MCPTAGLELRTNDQGTETLWWGTQQAQGDSLSSLRRSLGDSASPQYQEACTPSLPPAPPPRAGLPLEANSFQDEISGVWSPLEVSWKV